jgi:hypothetical protein
VSDAAGWIFLGPSSLQRRWWLAAGVLCALLAAALASKALTAAPAVLLVLASVANGAAAGWIFHRVRALGRENDAPTSVRIDFDGTVRVRRAGDGSGEAAEAAEAAAFVSSQVLVLSLGRRSLAIWRDAVPEAMYRRLAVAARWPRQQPADTAPSVGAPAP